MRDTSNRKALKAETECIRALQPQRGITMGMSSVNTASSTRHKVITRVPTTMFDTGILRANFRLNVERSVYHTKPFHLSVRNAQAVAAEHSVCFEHSPAPRP